MNADYFLNGFRFCFWRQDTLNDIKQVNGAFKSELIYVPHTGELQ